MDEWFSHLDGKKIAIITGVLVLIMGVFLLVSVVGVREAMKSARPNNPTRLLEQDSNEEKDSMSAIKQSLSRDYLTEYFVVSYPATWKGVISYLPGDIKVVTFTPVSESAAADVQFSITVDQALPPLEERLKQFSLRGYQTEVGYLGNRVFTKATGVNSASGSDQKDQSYQETHFFTTTQGKTIHVQYRYAAASKDTGYEQFFTKILSTVNVF